MSTAAEKLAAPAVPTSVEQRLGEIQKAVDHIKATGKTAQGSKTLSITDIEDALGDLFAVHGVLTPYTFNEPPVIHFPESKMPLWQVDITLRIISTDDKNDAIECRLIDVGGSPSAAVSFALKRHYRALLHLSDEQDEKREIVRSSTPVPAPRPTVAPESPVVDTGTPEQIQALYELAGSLKQPRSSKDVDKLLAYGFQKAQDRITAAHVAECGPGCLHTQGTLL